MISKLAAQCDSGTEPWNNQIQIREGQIIMKKYRRLSGSDTLYVYTDTQKTYNHTLKISILDPSTDPEGWSWEKFSQKLKADIHRLSGPGW